MLTSYPFPEDTPAGIKGDYAGLYPTLNVDSDTLSALISAETTTPPTTNAAATTTATTTGSGTTPAPATSSTAPALPLGLGQLLKGGMK